MVHKSYTFTFQVKFNHMQHHEHAKMMMQPLITNSSCITMKGNIA